MTSVSTRKNDLQIKKEDLLKIKVSHVLNKFGFKEKFINKIVSSVPIEQTAGDTRYGYADDFEGKKIFGIDTKNKKILLNDSATDKDILEESIHALQFSGEGFNSKQFNKDWEEAKKEMPELEQWEKDLKIDRKKRGFANNKAAIDAEKFAAIIRNYEDSPQILKKYMDKFLNKKNNKYDLGAVRVRFKGSIGEGGILNVADPTPFLESGKYELFEEPTPLAGGRSVGTAVTSAFQRTRTLNQTTSPPTAGGGLGVGEEVPAGLTPTQRQITTETHPRGLVTIGGQEYTYDENGNLVPVGGQGSEFELASRGRVLQEEADIKRGRFAQILGRQLEEFKEQEAERVRGEEATIRGGAGVTKGLGFSSAISDAITAVKTASEKRIRNAERELKDAAVNFDIREMERIRADISEEKRMQRERDQDIWNRFFKTKELEAAERGEAREAEKFEFQKQQFAQQLEQQKFDTAVQKYNLQLQIPEGQNVVLSTGEELIGLKEETKATANQLFSKYGDELIALGITPDAPLETAIANLQPLLKQRFDAESQQNIFKLEKIKQDINLTRAQIWKTQQQNINQTGQASPYQIERSNRTISQIDLLLPRVNRLTTGFGALSAALPESPARAFAADLDTLKSSIAFGELVAMREASKTGGALGNVSDRESKLLESALGALDPLRKPQEVKASLEQIKNSILSWQKATGIFTENVNLENQKQELKNLGYTDGQIKQILSSE